MKLTATKPKGYPAVYGFAGDYFSKVEPGIEILLNPNRRVLTLTQTISSAYDFHSFLLDFPNLRELLGKFGNSESDDLFWEAVEKVSVHKMFRDTQPVLKNIFNQSYSTLNCTGEQLVLDCQHKQLAFTTITKFTPTHFQEFIFKDCFNSVGKEGRGWRIERMQDACEILQRQYRLDDKLLNLYNLILYRNSFGYHSFHRIRQILTEAKEHALGYMKVVVTDDQYVLRKWQDIVCWHGANKKLGEVSKKIFADDPLANDFLAMIFYLRDYAFHNMDPVDIKIRLLSTFLQDQKRAKSMMDQVIADYPMAAPIWVKEKLKRFKTSANLK